MLDTFVFEVVNLWKYPGVIDKIHVPGTGETKSRIYFNGNARSQTLTRYHNEGNEVLSTSGKIHIPSSHYEVAWYVQHSRRMVFNVSIPKFMYGHNLRMFVPHKLDKDFDYVRNSSLEYNLKISHDRLHNFIIFFNNTYLNVDLEDIRLVRLDFCFNRVFDNLYLKRLYQSVISKKRFRYVAEKKNAPVYGQDLYSVGKHITRKVYDKGIEFAKNDYKKLNRYSDENVNKLQKVADRILRYEMEFKIGFFKDYVHNELCVAPYSSRYKKYLCDKWTERVVQRELLDFWHGRPALCFDSQKINFFNQKLFILAANRFRDFLYEMSALSIDNGTELRAKVDRHNSYCKQSIDKRDKKVNFNALRRFIEDNSRYGKNEIFYQRLYGRSTYYRYLSLLRKLGYNNPEITTPLSFGSALSLERYHEIFY